VPASAAQVAQSFSEYDAALESAPDPLTTKHGYALVAVSDAQTDAQVAAAIQVIELRGEGATRRTWAQVR
jgi:hypothetical protein